MLMQTTRQYRSLHMVRIEASKRRIITPWKRGYAVKLYPYYAVLLLFPALNLRPLCRTGLNC